MAASKRRSRKSGKDRAVGSAYAIIPLALVALVLPSALRPPPATTQSGAQYSPDAPPNSKAQSIVKTEFQPGSSTAGQEGVGVPPPPPPPSPTPAASPTPQRGGTYGCTNDDPPLQWDSVYAVECRPAFVGNNGGATDLGVTANSISVGVSFFGQQQTDGPINDASAQTSAQLRTLNDIQKYFNIHAMMYNRKLQLNYITEGGGTADESTQRSDADNGISKYHPIAAMIEGTPPEIDEYYRNHILTQDWETLTEDVYQNHKPYAWGQNSPTTDAGLAAEWICKQLKGLPPIAGVRTGNAGYDPKAPRKWGSIEENIAHFNSGPTLLKGLSTCDIHPLDQLTGASAANDVQNALLKFQSEGVTSVIMNIDLVTAIGMEAQASSINYYPEWITTGWGGMDQDAYLVRDTPADQLTHTFGLSTTEINRDPKDMECYRAVASVDSGFSAHALYCHIYWEMISHLVDAIELAGPHLTRKLLAATYPHIPPVRMSPKNNWAIIGGYTDPRRRSWANAASVWWWDTQHVDADGSVGTEAYADCARRYLAGTFPSRPAHIYTSSGYYTGMNFGKKCTPPP